MCGIFFYINNKNNIQSEKLKKINQSFKLLDHRGPDNQKYYKKDNWFIAHSRLSIIDLASRSHQPFTDQNKRFFLSFNGEIYNYLELKTEMENQGYIFKTSSDTEVLYSLLLIKGIDKTLKIIKGMFSFIFFDSKTNTVYGARDHFGQKPFHYSFLNNTFTVASEIPPLLNLLDKNEVNEVSFRTYLCSNGIIDPSKTFFKEINTLKAGHYIKFYKGKISIKKYFNILDLHNFELENKKLNFSANLEQFDYLLDNSIKNHTLSNVPIGLLFSGGIDSSLILNYLSKNKIDFSTFTKLSPGIEDIPQQIIPLILKNISVNSHFVDQNKKKYLKESYDFIKHTATPARWGGGPSMFSLCKNANQKGIKVLLSGDGVDELCHGYNSHQQMLKNFDGNLLKLHKIVDIDTNSPFFEKNLLNEFTHNRLKERKIAIDKFKNIKDIKEIFSKVISYQDMEVFLQTCNLPHSDLYSMKASVELRNPFLDMSLVKFILNLTIDQKHKLHSSGFHSKFIFRSLAEKIFGNFINTNKEGTRNYSAYISNNKNWNFKNFKINDFFPINHNTSKDNIFKIINLEIFYRIFFLRQNNFLDQILTNEGMLMNEHN